MKAALETVEEGKLYKVLLTPEQTTTPFMAVVSIETTISPDVHKFFQAYAQVKAPDFVPVPVSAAKKGEALPPAGGNK
jgi:hypothetical protein